MNARDELAELLAKHEDCAFSASGVLVCSCGAAMQPQEVMDDMANLAAHQADVLHAAGYRKPRTITTADELDALPVGSVILYHGRAFQRAAETAGPFGEYKKWRCGDGGFVRSTKDGASILPATVLYESRSVRQPDYRKPSTGAKEPQCVTAPANPKSTK